MRPQWHDASGLLFCYDKAVKIRKANAQEKLSRHEAVSTSIKISCVLLERR